MSQLRRERAVEPRRQGQRKQRPEGAAAHGCDVAGIHGSQLPPQIGRAGPAEPEVNTLGEQVGREQQPGAARRTHRGRIVAGTDDDGSSVPGAGSPPRTGEDAHDRILPDPGQRHLFTGTHNGIVARKH